MFSEFNNVRGSQQNYSNLLSEITGFPPALSQEELDALWAYTVEPDVEPRLEHPVPGSVTCNEIHTSTPRKRLELRVLTKISTLIFTGKKNREKGCGVIKVGLFDSITGILINSGPEASAEVELLLLKEVFDSVRDDDWMPEEFEKNIVEERTYKKPLLAGIRKLNLKEGICLFENVSFTHDKKWFSKSKFRLGVRLVENFNGVRVREAKTEPFELKDQRLKCNMKRFSPSLRDDIWRLKKINRNGPRDARLRGANIKTVKEFLIQLVLDTPKLRKIYGAGPAGGKDWEATVRHARMCTDKMVCYPSSSRKQIGAIVNASGEVLGLLSEGKSIHMDKLSGFEKANAQKLVMSAFEHPENVDMFDDEKDLMHGSPELTNAPNPSNSSSGLCNGTKDMIDNHDDHTQPSTSYQDIHSLYSGECYSPCGSIEQIPNAPVDYYWFSDFGTQNSEFHGSYGCAPDYANQVDQLNATGESTTSVGSGVGLFGMAQKRWKKLSSIWFSMRFLVRKIGSAGFHAKKLSLCQHIGCE